MWRISRPVALFPAARPDDGCYLTPIITVDEPPIRATLL